MIYTKNFLSDLQNIAMPFFKNSFYYNGTDFFSAFIEIHSGYHDIDRIVLLIRVHTWNSFQRCQSSCCRCQLSTWSGTRGAICWSRCRRARCFRMPCQLWCTWRVRRDRGEVLFVYLALFYFNYNLIWGIFNTKPVQQVKLM